ncbi:PREDICTED: SAC3 family protein C [Camelina sativa]|uniref:SAC3 family protein C n=1 Tax=Camelina sativa TaxID=90675 RepID=A0ABM0YQ18_CAMSA|nr:PREDICTED: SAC3 family protein C [Camelina sativa]
MNRRNRGSSSSSSSSRVSSYGNRQFSDNRRTQSGGGATDYFRRRSDVPVKRNNDKDESDNKGEDHTDVSFIVGTCSSMCPERERVTRERLRDLAVFERLYGNPSKSSTDLAVKKFCRTLSAADVQASDVRPLPVLEETLKYLLSLLDSREHPFEVVHDFIFDRTRSIRQDLSIQNLANERVIYLYEEMVKFHVISHKRLQSCSGTSISPMHHLNMEQLAKTLTSLYNIYDANRKSDSTHENEAEFRSLYVLLHLNPSSGVMGEPLSLWFRKLTFALVKSKEICFVRNLLRLYRMGNYKNFLSRIASEATYLQYCISEPHIREMRSVAVQYINSVCYKLQPYSLLRLSQNLMMKELDVESLCHGCGLQTCTDSDGFTVLTTKQSTFRSPEDKFKVYDLIGIERMKR